MGCMLYHESADTLYHIGGMNSEGVDYKMKLTETKWEQLNNNPSSSPRGEYLAATGVKSFQTGSKFSPPGFWYFQIFPLKKSSTRVHKLEDSSPLRCY